MIWAWGKTKFCNFLYLSNILFVYLYISKISDAAKYLIFCLICIGFIWYRSQNLSISHSFSSSSSIKQYFYFVFSTIIRRENSINRYIWMLSRNKIWYFFHLTTFLWDIFKYIWSKCSPSCLCVYAFASWWIKILTFF